MRLSYSKPLVLVLAGLLALPIPLAWASGNSPAKPLQDIYNAQGQLIGQTRNAAPASAEPAADPGYTISKLSHKTDTIDVFYPQLDMSNMFTSVLVNYQLFQVPGSYASALAPAATLHLDYTITRQEQDLLSVVFRGEELQEGSSKPLIASVNYNLKTRVRVTPSRLIRDTDAARQGVKQLLQQAAGSNPAAANLPAITDKLGYYLTGKYVVFYYQPDDAGQFIELPVAIEQIRPYLADEYRTLAVTAEVSKDPRQLVADIDKALPGYQAVSGKRGNGDTAVEFTAYFANGVLAYAEEKQTKEYEKGVSKYYFEDGKLLAYKKSAENLMVPLSGVASVQREEAALFYDASLNRTDGELLINGAAAKLPESTIKAAYAAAGEIQTQSAALLAEAKQ